ncbi:Bug family tripartite tricarboxylate transporter substrate binding protein, partial [Leptospira sp. SA-E8]|uniref:Bug family tripartite tricarboxylate transporter substrate binding protein n=1 Tax=Leptospira sp. SA-E8 TaxID=3422259 RepID=UPI003EBEC4D5
MKLFNSARRAFIAGTVATLAGIPAWAQGVWPTKPVTIYTAFAPGSGPDVVARLVGQRLSELWKQSVMVDNRPGGAGFVAMDAVRRLPADGYALLQLDSEHLSAVPHLYKARNFQTLDVFDPVAPLFLTPFLVAVSTNSPWKNMSDLIAAAKARPDTVTYGSWFVGSPGHLGGAWLDMLAGTKMVHVPYRQVSELYTAVANGDVAWAYGSIPSTQGVYQAGKLRYLAVATQKRIPQMPDLPTIAEAGGPQGIDVNSFVSLVAPKGVPDAVRAKVHADVLKVLAEPAIRERFNTFAFQPLDWSVETIRKNAKTKS